MKIIDELSKKSHLSEMSHGNKEIRFAFIDPEKKTTITPFCRCKDYFTDMFWSNATKQNVDIYGFKWKPDQDNGILKKDRLSIAIKLTVNGTRSKLTDDNSKNIKNLLNKFESGLKFKLTETQLSSDGNNIIIDISKQWTKIPYLISALFMLIRLGFSYSEDTDPIEFFESRKSVDFYSCHDQIYFKQAKKRLKDLLNGKIDKKQKFNMYTASSIHDESGLISYNKYSV